MKAKKHDMDFEYQCCFRHQIAGIGDGIEHGNGEIAMVPMKSGRVALYKVASVRISYGSDDTELRNWHFGFQGYVKNRDT